MHISAIRTYIVTFQGDEFQGNEGMADLFPGEVIYNVKEICEIPRILRVETALSIQGQSETACVEPVEKGKAEGSMDFTGEAIDEKKHGSATSDVINTDHFESKPEIMPKSKGG